MNAEEVLTRPDWSLRFLSVNAAVLEGPKSPILNLDFGE